MNKRQSARICIVGTGVFLLILWAFCFGRVNRLYPQAQTICVNMNEPLTLGAYTVTVTSVSIKDTVPLYEQNGISAQGKVLPEKMLLCTVTVTQNAPEEAQFHSDKPRIAAVAGAWKNWMDTGELYAALNREQDKTAASSPDSQQIFVWPFGLWRDSFSGKTWETIYELPFTLQLSLYPMKYEIFLTTKIL